MYKNHHFLKAKEKIEKGDLIFSINDDGKTVSIIGNKVTTDEILIPRSIVYNSKEYVITSILHWAFQFSEIKTVKFSADSEIITIDRLAFSESSIESFTIPPHLKQIKEFAFVFCKQLRSIEIPPNSELETIENDAFSGTAIERFTISPHLTKISKSIFCNCQNLRTIEIPENSNLSTIESGAFDGSSIESLFLPSSLIMLKWCCNALQLTKVIVSTSNPRYSTYSDKMVIGKSDVHQTEYFDVLVFCARNIITIEIPSFIKVIGPYAFERCFKQHSIEIHEDSKLQIIDTQAFFGSSIESFKIPLRLTRINQYAFSYCQKLRTIEIPLNSKLHTIDKYAFFESSIESFIFTSNLSVIGDSAFSCCKQLKIIEIDEKSPIKYLDRNIFDGCNDFIIMIPVDLTFLFCSNGNENNFIKNVQKSICNLS